FDEFESILTGICADGQVSELERQQLKVFLGDFVDARDSYNINQAEMDELKSKIHISGVCALCPEIVFENHLFCFTGESTKMKRNDIAEIVSERNGLFADSVSGKTNYLVVGAGGNPCWAFSCYGRKVEKAVDLRKKGNPIVIVHENDFWDAM
ncbi:MAG: BRCT domain-containing protein, partial [Oscillospiraceae bacterium]